MGGAERYQVDLCRLLKEMGFYVEVWQIGSGWIKEFDGVTIRSIPVTKSEYYTFPDLTTAFYENSMAFDYAIYFILTLAYPVAREKALPSATGYSGIGRVLTWWPVNPRAARNGCGA